MSYDYNELVTQIVSSRQNAAAAGDNVEEKLDHLQHASEAFSTLSSHCPMTPLLWMQYASDTMDLLQTLGTDSVEALETRLSILQLGLSEFPGSAPLNVHYLQLLRGGKHSATESRKPGSDYDKKMVQELNKAIENVGSGSHRNEGDMIASIYNLAASHHLSNGRRQDALDCFCQRAGIPMRIVNDGIVTELEQLLASAANSESNKPLSAEEKKNIESCRRQESKIYGSLVTLEDELDIAMHTEGILSRHQISSLDDSEDWDKLLRENHHKFWMGFGGVHTANAFIKYAQFCGRFRLKHDDDSFDSADKLEVEKQVRALALSVYERGVSECPTVEALWLSYIRYLHYQLRTQEKLSDTAQRLQNILTRAVRNCPYSLALYKQRLNAVQILAEAKMVVFDPDELMKTVQEAINSKFITDPSSCLDLYLSAIQVTKRRILWLLASVPTTSSSSKEISSLCYDDSEPLNLKSPFSETEIDDSTQQDVQDLCEDIREMFDTVDSYLRKSHTSWSEGRALLWSDRAYAEKELISPLLKFFTEEDNDNGELLPSEESKSAEEFTRCFDKLVKIQQPPHPDSFSSYIHSFRVVRVTSPVHILSKLRQMRGLFQRALKLVGKPKESSQLTIQAVKPLDYETSLRCLCQEYLVFEKNFGSESSFYQASTAIQKKLAKVLTSAPTTRSEAPVQSMTLQDSTTENIGRSGDGLEEEQKKFVTITAGNDAGVKRKLSSTDENLPRSEKKPRTTDDMDTSKVDGSTVSQGTHGSAPGIGNESTDGPKATKEIKHKVRIGKLDYPAHPLTVRVSNLASDTSDMDLVDCFRPKCGAIVHARIVREKHHHGKGASRGWGLVQFEEHKSVDEALKLSDVVGIHEKLVNVERSHVPAVSLVPPGMHRVNPKGEGKSSKRNLKRKERKFASADASGNAGQTHQQSKLAENQPAIADGRIIDEKKPQQSPNIGILAFRPRGVGKGRPHRRLNLEGAQGKND